MTKVFENTGDFAAINAAEKWCADQGYTVGRMDGDNPIGIAKGVNYISKWHNFQPGDTERLGGRITSRNFRDGPVTVTLNG